MIHIYFKSPMDVQESEDIEQFINELPWRLPQDSSVYNHIEPKDGYLTSVIGRGGGQPLPVEILVALATVSGAIITATVNGIYIALSKYLEKDTNREVTIEADGRRITLKGHSLKDSKQLLQELYPQVFEVSDSEIPPSLFESYYGKKRGIWIRSDVPEDLDFNSIDINDYLDSDDDNN